MRRREEEEKQKKKEEPKREEKKREEKKKEEPKKEEKKAEKDKKEQPSPSRSHPQPTSSYPQTITYPDEKDIEEVNVCGSIDDEECCIKDVRTPCQTVGCPKFHFCLISPLLFQRLPNREFTTVPWCGWER